MWFHLLEAFGWDRIVISIGQETLSENKRNRFLDNKVITSASFGWNTHLGYTTFSIYFYIFFKKSETNGVNTIIYLLDWTLSLEIFDLNESV